MKPWKVISFYTAEYESAADRLRASLEEYSIQHELHRLDGPDLCGETWLHRVQWKPIFVRHRYGQCDENIVWLDADAEVIEYPIIFDQLDVDFACVRRTAPRRAVSPRSRFSTGTMYFGRTPQAAWLLDCWAAACAEERAAGRQRTEQDILQQCWPQWGKTLSTCWLPMTYSRIYDRPREGRPIIKQWQASRGRPRCPDVV